MAAWIRMIEDAEASGELSGALEMARTPHGTVDNVMRVHSLRPSTMVGHIKLYRSVLHDESNELPEWLQETVGSYVSLLNGCDYSWANHWANARHLIGDSGRAVEIERALRTKRPGDAFDGEALALLEYAERLTLAAAEIQQSDVDALKRAGLDDGRILEANQIICYFNYVNRLLNGLGVTTEGDVVGYYASEAEPPAIEE